MRNKEENESLVRLKVTCRERMFVDEREKKERKDGEKAERRSYNAGMQKDGATEKQEPS